MMHHRFNRCRSTFVVICWVMGWMFSPVAHATLAENLTVSPEALSMGNAVTADPPGIFSIHYNPAGLTQFESGLTNHMSILLPPSITSEAKFTAPSDYKGVLGYTDDPVIGQTSKMKQVTAYVPTKGIFRIDDKFLPLPLGGIAYRPEGSKFVFANAAYAYVVAGLRKEDDDFAGAYAARDTVIQRVVFLSPSIAAQVSDTFSVGMSVGFNYSAFALDQEVRANNISLGLARFVTEEICPQLRKSGNLPLLPPRCLGDEPLNPFNPLANIKLEATDPFGVSMNLGMLWTPNPNFSLGVAYQAPYKANMRGEFDFTYYKSLRETIGALSEAALVKTIMEIFGLPTYVSQTESGDVRLDLEFPAHVAIGTRFRFNDRVQMNLDWHWTDWEKWGTLTAITNRTTTLNKLGRYMGIATPTRLNLNIGLENQPNLAFGVKYFLSSRTDLRAGVEYRRSSLAPDRLSYQLPFGDTWLYGVGFAHKLNSTFKIDFSLAHFVSDVSIPAGTSKGANDQGIDNVLSPYAGLDVHFKTQGLLGAVTIESKF